MVDRLSFGPNGYPGADPSGPYVRYSDYASLEAELKAAQEALANVRGLLKVEYLPSGGRPSIAYDGEALPAIVAILDAALSQPPVGERGWNNPVGNWDAEIKPENGWQRWPGKPNIPYDAKLEVLDEDGSIHRMNARGIGWSFPMTFRVCAPASPDREG